MNIAFDATAILANMSRNRGIGNYVTNLFEHLLKLDKTNNYYCFNMYNRLLENGWEEKYDNFWEIKYYSGESIELLRLAEYKSVLKKIVMEFLETYKINIFFVTSPFDPVITIYEQKWFRNVRTIAIVYDIIPYVFKDTYFISRTIQKKYMEQVDMLRWMDKCLAISDSTKNDMVRYLDFLSDKIDVIWGAADQDIYKELNLSYTEKENIKQQFGITDKFFLCTGGDEPRKNMDGLINAYLHVPVEIRNKYQLVIVCKISESTERKYLEMAQKCGASDQIIFTGFLPTEELVWLYNLSSALLLPSKYEGFGLPVVEAWQCGTAVLTSNNSALKEIGGESAVLVNADSIENIALGIEQIADEEQNAIYKKRGKECVKLYTWDNVAGKVKDVIKQLPVQPEIKKKAIQKIAVFTPLPPIESGISDYSYDILCELSRYFDIDVFIDNGYTVECLLPKNVKIYRHYEFVEKISEYGDIIYQVGNSWYHKYMFDYIEEFKGTVVLHDLNLHPILDFVSGMGRGQRFLQYKQALLEDMTETEMNSYISKRFSNFTGGAISRNPVNGFVVNYAKKIIVHSVYAKQKLLQKDIMRDVAVIPLYAKTVKLPKNKKAGMIYFMSFGFATVPKRIMPILKAFRYLIEEGNKAKWILVGKMDNGIETEFYNYIDKYALHDWVELTGYIPLGDFERYIEKADICLSLRYPYMGESSGALARLVGMGKCCIVNNIGSFSELPDDACIKIPSVDQMTDKEEIDSIYAAMKYAMNDEVRETVGNNAYKYAEANLNIHTIGEMYRDVITDVWKRKISNYDLQCLILTVTLHKL